MNTIWHDIHISFLIFKISLLHCNVLSSKLEILHSNQSEFVFLCCEFIKFTFKYIFIILHFPVFNLIIKTFQWHWEGFGPLDSHDLGFEPQDGYPLNQHRHVFFTNSHLTPGFSPSQGRIWGYVSLLAISLGFHCLVASKFFHGRSKHFLRRVFNEVSPKRPQHQIIPRWNYAPATSF